MEPDDTALLIALVALVVVGAGIWWIASLIRDEIHLARWRREQAHQHAQDARTATEDNRALHIHLLNLGFTEDDIRRHRTTTTRRHEIPHDEYSFPREQLVAHLRDALTVQRDMTANTPPTPNVHAH